MSVQTHHQFLLDFDNEQLFRENSNFCFFTKLQEIGIWTNYQHRSLPLPAHEPSAICLSGSSGARAVTFRRGASTQAALEKKKRQLTLWSEAGNSRCAECWKKASQNVTKHSSAVQCRAAGASYTSSGTPQHTGRDSSATANCMSGAVSSLLELQHHSLKNKKAFILILCRLNTLAVFHNVS